MSNRIGRLQALAVAVTATIALSGAGQRVDTSAGEAAAGQIITTEAEFQAAVQAEGISPAFSRYGVPEAIVFAPDPVVVGRYYATPHPGVLQWRPEAVASSSGGDLLATTGPGRFTGPDGAISTSWYLSVWRRQGNGFRFAIDTGVDTDGDYLNAAPTPYDIAVGRGRPGASFNLTNLESEYARDAARDARRATSERLDEQRGRVLRNGARAAIGRAQAQTLLASGPATVQLTYRDGSVSNTGDLAYSWGTATWTDGSGAARNGHYVHVWIRNGRDWRLIMDLLAPRREPAPAPAAPAAPASPDPAAAPAPAAPAAAPVPGAAPAAPAPTAPAAPGAAPAAPVPTAPTAPATAPAAPAPSTPPAAPTTPS